MNKHCKTIITNKGNIKEFKIKDITLTSVEKEELSKDAEMKEKNVFKYE